MVDPQWSVAKRTDAFLIRPFQVTVGQVSDRKPGRWLSGAVAGVWIVIAPTAAGQHTDRRPASHGSHAVPDSVRVVTGRGRAGEFDVHHHDFRTVLVVVPDGAAAGFMDVLSLVAADHRVRMVFTVAPAPSGATDAFLRAHGCSVLPWSYAVRREFDLVLASGAHELPRLSGKRSLLAVAHESELSASRGPGLVVGDLCYDRLLASIPFRAGYRRAFGLSRGQKLVVVTSPAGRGLVAGLPVERYRTVVAGAPDVWRPAVVAADLIIADNYGPVTRYGAAIGVPLMVTAPSSAGGVAGLVSRYARPLRLDRPLPSQVDAAMRRDRAWQDGVAARITARPGRAGEILRKAMYRLLDLAEPAWAVSCLPVPLPLLAEAETSHGETVVILAASPLR